MLNRFEIVAVELFKLLDDALDYLHVGAWEDALVRDIRNQVLSKRLTVSLALGIELIFTLLDRF